MAKRVSLGQRMDTAAATGLRDDLLSDPAQDLVIDGSEVEQFGGLCLEVLMSAAALWKMSGHTISMENPSEQMVDDLARLGLTPDTLLESAE